MSTAPSLLATDELELDSVVPVEALLRRAEQADDAPALNEAGRLALRRRRAGVSHLLRLADGEVLGYAQLTETDGTSTGQVVVDPVRRRVGHGTALVTGLRRRSRYPLQMWALGDTAAAQALARAAQLVPVRTLLIMTRDLAELPAAPPLPDGARIDTFAPGRDESGWLEVNRRAFATHPEQGTLTEQDLADRMAEPWFDPAGFFLARSTSAEPARFGSAGALLGFHWTKQHPGGLGEVYVIGVDPDAQGRGLATPLLLTGLSYLRDRGNASVELYVEADAQRAVGLYTRHGFGVNGRDVMYGVSRSN